MEAEFVGRLASGGPGAASVGKIEGRSVGIIRVPSDGGGVVAAGVGFAGTEEAAAGGVFPFARHGQSVTARRGIDEDGGGIRRAGLEDRGADPVGGDEGTTEGGVFPFSAGVAPFDGVVPID